MTASTITRSEALVIARASAALTATDQWLAANQDREARLVRSYMEWLREALEAYEGLADGSLHPASEYPELARWWPDDAQGQALGMAAANIADDTGALVLTVREQCGDGTAESVLAAVDGAEAGQ